MGRIADAFHNAWRDFVTNGNPSSGRHNPSKADLRAIGPLIEQEIDEEVTAREAAIIAERQAREQADAELAQQIEGASEGVVQAATWASLNAIVGSRVGQPGRVPATDTGSHTDPVVGGSVPNSGEYSWSNSPAGWRRVGDARRTESELFAQRGTLPAGANLNEYLLPGTYLGDGAVSYLMTPTGFTSSFFLTNEGYGGPSGAGSSRFVKQTLTNYTNTGVIRQQWERTVDRQNLPTTDIWAARHTIYALNLSDSFEYRGAISGTSYNDVRADGLYVASGGMTDGPAGAPAGALVKNRRFGNFIVQELTSITDATVGWRRVIQGASTYHPWIAFGGGGSGSDISFAGKRIVCFGDSITEGGNYPLLLGLRLGADTINGGFGGCRMAVHSLPQYDPMSMYRLSEYMRDDSWQTLIDAAQALFEYNADDNRPNAAALAGVDWSEVDYAVIFYGTNDFTANIPIGSPTDTTAETFAGAINVTVQNILSSYPHIKLMFVTPLWRDLAETPNANGDVLADFADAIIERARAYQIEVFDMYRRCGINALTSDTYLADGTHPIAGFGYQHVADKISAGLRSSF